MNPNDRYDSLIQFYAKREGLNWRLIKRVIEAESSFRPTAVSKNGAVGLAQFMEQTWAEWGDGRRDNPEESIQACCRYLKWLYRRFPEIPDPTERWRFAIAAYNCGRSNINKALGKARLKAGHPESHVKWVALGQPPGPWQTWQFTRVVLPLVTGQRSRETRAYVAKILPE